MTGRTFGLPRCLETSTSRRSATSCKGIAATLGAMVALSACSGSNKAPPGVGGVPADNALKGGEPRIGLLLPLTGRNARLGQQMANAAHIASPDGHGVQLDIRDSDAPDGVAAVARAAVQNGDRILLGPLTASQTAEVAGIAQAAQIPELAFTSDTTQARPGVWIMGLTPEQQVMRLVEAARADGRHKFAAFLPDSAFGHVMARALQQACAANGLDSPNVVFHSADPDDITQKLKSLADIESRQAQVQSSAPASGEPDAVNPTAEQPSPATNATQQVAAATLPAPPFDALLLGDTGLQLATVIRSLKDSRVDSGQVRFLGPALWNAFASKLGALKGAWFAGPNPALRNGYVQRYRTRNGYAPSVIADVAYDTTAMAAALGRQDNGFSLPSLTRADGFAGVDGVFALRPDGKVARGLAVFEILPGGGVKMTSPAPRRLVQTPS